MEDKKQTLIAHQDIFNSDGTLEFMIVMEYKEKEGKVEHVYKAKYPNHYFAPDPFLERYRMIFS